MGFMDKLQEKLLPLATKLDSNRYLSAIRSGFFGAMSILIIGSIFLLLANLPIPAYTNLMKSVLGDNWGSYFMKPYTVTMNIMTLYVIVGLAKGLADFYNLDSVPAIISALSSFLVLTPVLSSDAGTGIPMSNLGASGLFLGMIVAVLSVEILRWVLAKGWVIKMPESVPSNVSQAFSSLIPTAILLFLFNIVRIIFQLTPFGTAQDFIFKILQTPLLALGSSLPANIVVLFFEALLWLFGIHGSNIVGAVMTPIWTTLTVQNADAFAAGLALPNIYNSTFYGNFIKIGGSSGTLGLAICLLLFAKSKQYKTLGKLAFGPALFNINEPMVFGIPIVLNPTMAIPFVLNPIIQCCIAYFAMWSGLVPYTNGVSIPWTTPPIFSGFLLCGWQGAVLQIFQILLGIVIFFPFFKMVDRAALKLEAQSE